MNTNVMRTVLKNINNKALLLSRNLRTAKDYELNNNLVEGVMEFLLPDRDVFFGYYDKTPFSSSGEKLLYLESDTETVKGNKSICKIGWIDMNSTSSFTTIAQTQLCSTQLGCRLQWVPHSSDNLIIYNCEDKNGLGSVMQDINTNQIIKRFDAPIFDVEPDGKHALSIDFSRLHKFRRSYGYKYMNDFLVSPNIYEDTGIWRINLLDGSKELILSLGQIIKINPILEYEKSDHYLNHIAINPSGNRFLFIHLWEYVGKRKSRLITVGVDGSNPYAIESNTNMSHYAWKDDKNFVVHTSKNEKGKVQYVEFEDQTEKKKLLYPNQLYKSGHPSYSPCKKYMLVDTYPDRRGDQTLFMVNLLTGRRMVIGKFYSPPKFRGDNKCDLHPRFDGSGKLICIDSAHTGKRGMYVIKLKEFERII